MVHLSLAKGCFTQRVFFRFLHYVPETSGHFVLFYTTCTTSTKVQNAAVANARQGNYLALGKVLLTPYRHSKSSAIAAEQD